MNGLAEQFDEVLNRIAMNLKKHGVFKESALLGSEFRNLSSHKQAQVLKKASLQLEQMELIDPSLSPKDYIDVLCSFHRLVPADKDIHRRLHEDMLWEILDFDFNQIYRSKNIYKVTNYGISQMEEHTPFELYDRPRVVVDQLMEVVHKLRTTKMVVNMTHIKPYLLKELKSDQHGILQIQHQFVCPLLDVETQEIKAFIAGFDAIKLPSIRAGSNILLLS